MRQERNPGMSDGKVELPSLSRRETLVVAGAGLLSVLTGCKVVGPTPGETGQTSATATTEAFPTASPEVILAIEKSAQTAIDQSFSGLGIHEPKVVGGPLKDALGTEFALFKTQLPDKKGGRDLEFLMLGQVNGQNSVENIRGLVVDENAPKSDIVDFLGVTYDSANAIFSLEGPFARTNVKTGEIELFRQGVWVPLLAPVPTMDAVKKEVALGVLAAPALPTPTPTEAPTPTEIPIKVGLPEKFEDIQVVKEENLDTFMPRLLEAEKQYVQERPELFKFMQLYFTPPTEWEKQPKVAPTVEPYNSWLMDMFNFNPETQKNLPLAYTSWTKIQMKDGTETYLLGIYTKVINGKNKESISDQSVFLHLLVNPPAMEKEWSTPDQRDGYQKRASPEALFQNPKDGYNSLLLFLLNDSTNPSQKVIEDFGWQNSGEFLEKNDKEFDFSNKFKEWVKKGVKPGEDYIAKLQISPLPVWYASIAFKH